MRLRLPGVASYASRAAAGSCARSRFDLHDVARLPEILDRLAKNDFHDVNSDRL